MHYLYRYVCILNVFYICIWTIVCNKEFIYYKHIPKESRIFNKRKHKKEPWMTNNLLVHINRKNDMYREWKSTSNNEDYENKKINFKTFDKMVTEEIKNENISTISILSLLTKIILKKHGKL